jgi:hypothetical protein
MDSIGLTTALGRLGFPSSISVVHLAVSNLDSIGRRMRNLGIYQYCIQNPNRGYIHKLSAGI